MKKKLFYLLIVGAVFTLSSCDYLSSIVFNQKDDPTDDATEFFVEEESPEENVNSTNGDEIKYGNINDPDGYTNVREGKSSKSEILFQIYEDEKFIIQNNEGDWWLIEFNDNHGYIHNSRISIIN